MTRYKYSLKNQNITFKDVILDMPPKNSTVEALHYLALIAAFLFGLAVMATIRSCGSKPTTDDTIRCYDCHRKLEFEKYFKKAGSKSPEAMAVAVLHTKNPRLLAAVAKVETGGNPNVRNTGFNKKHSGAFQVNPKHWGRVSHDPVEQALQAEAILTELTATMPIKKALSAYGGDSSSRYARTVLAELMEVP